MKTLCFAVIALLLLSACAAPTPVQPYQQPPVPTPLVSEPPVCKAKDCFIKAANDCQELEVQLVEEAGEFRYNSKNCVFTKMLVKANPQETAEMKNLLEGKSVVCKYEKGKFDARWVETLFFGTERCEGKLRDVLASLLIFAQ